MDEKLIVIDVEDEIISSFVKPFSELGLHLYLTHHNLNLVQVIEMTAFVFVSCEFK